MHHPDVFLHAVCSTGWFSFDCDGLWPLLGHLPPPALHSHHDPWLCGLLVLVCWITSALLSLLESLLVLQLSFCTDLEIPHFFCEIKQVVLLACCDTFLNDVFMYFTAVLLGGGPLAGILYSYSKIVFSIRGISSPQGKYKAFSTCVSHLLVVFLYYCSSLGVSLSSAATHSSHSSATASVMYTVVTPMLNPFTYSLRNKDIKRALKGFIQMVVEKRKIILSPKTCPWRRTQNLKTRNSYSLIRFWMLNLLLLLIS